MVSGPCIAAEATNTEATGARRSSYDVVVIGAGIAGLVAGALLARVGKAVLVVESDPQPGGYAQSLRHGEHVFDRADHLTWGAEPEGPLTPGLWDALLRYLDVRSECEFLRVDNVDPDYLARRELARIGNRLIWGIDPGLEHTPAPQWQPLVIPLERDHPIPRVHRRAAWHLFRGSS